MLEAELRLRLPRLVMRSTTTVTCTPSGRFVSTMTKSRENFCKRPMRLRIPRLHHRWFLNDLLEVCVRL
jgi:hypothetical protein